MKYRLTALIALAAITALPAVASAATMRGDPAMDPSIPAFPTVTIPRNGDAPAIMFQAEHAYLDEVCPTVLDHSAGYSGVLDRFCQEAQG